MHDPAFVLVLEDNLDHAELLLMALKERGFRAECSSDGSTSLSRILRELPDLVLLDIGVPRINGALIAKAMRSDPRTSAIPIVFQSARPEMEIKRDFADYDAYFLKPFDLSKLLAAIASLTARRPRVS